MISLLWQCSRRERERQTTRRRVNSTRIFSSGSVDLLAYLNDILIALRHLSRANITVESDDDDDDESLDDEDEPILPSSSSDSDPNPLCLYATTKKEYGNQHWSHCHSCKMIERVDISYEADCRSM